MTCQALLFINETHILPIFINSMDGKKMDEKEVEADINMDMYGVEEFYARSR